MKYFLVGLLALLFVGCGAKKQSNIYCWDGTYAKSVYEYINQDGDINEQIANLENLIQKSYNETDQLHQEFMLILGFYTQI